MDNIYIKELDELGPIELQAMYETTDLSDMLDEELVQRFKWVQELVDAEITPYSDRQYAQIIAPSRQFASNIWRELSHRNYPLDELVIRVKDIDILDCETMALISNDQDILETCRHLWGIEFIPENIGSFFIENKDGDYVNVFACSSSSGHLSNFIEPVIINGRAFNENHDPYYDTTSICPCCNEMFDFRDGDAHFCEECNSIICDTCMCSDDDMCIECYKENEEEDDEQ